MTPVLQLTFDTFTVGRFQSFTSEGCPDGFMTIREEGRPATGGQWCGSAWGYTVYYSETPSINLTLYLLRLSEQVRNASARSGIRDLIFRNFAAAINKALLSKLFQSV